jgi:hypothetical protein
VNAPVDGNLSAAQQAVAPGVFKETSQRAAKRLYSSLSRRVASRGLLRPMGPRSTHWGTGIWFLLCTGLAGGVALELFLPLAPQVTAALPAAPVPEFAPEPGTFDPPPRHMFAQITARPLFSASRRPFAAESETAKELTPAESIAIELIGTLLTAQGGAALLQPQGQNARWLQVGERIAGWQVETIQRDQVSLHLDGEAKTLELRADLVQPATPTKRAERRRGQGSAEPDDQGQAQDQKRQPPEQDQAQDQGGQPDAAKAGEPEAAEPRTD